MYDLLIGKDIILRKANINDLNNIYNNVWKDETIFKYMNYSSTKTLEEAKIRLDKSIEFQKNNYAYFICLRNNDEAIGFCGIKKVNETQVEEIGICISQIYQHHSYGKQTLKLLLALTFNNLKAQEFLYYVHQDNTPSIKLCLSFGFEKNINYKANDNILLYSLTRSKYYKNKPNTHKVNNLTGEDIQLLNESKVIKHINICDNHWDGA